jgi:hypothetical protein
MRPIYKAILIGGAIELVFAPMFVPMSLRGQPLGPCFGLLDLLGMVSHVVGGAVVEVVSGVVNFSAIAGTVASVLLQSAVWIGLSYRMLRPRMLVPQVAGPRR